MADKHNGFVISAEGAALLRRQFEIDYAGAGPKAPVSSFMYKGVEISSRWSVLREFETMKRAIDLMPELMSRRLSRIWCDSKCTANYVIGVKPGLFVQDVQWEINDAFCSASGGHNGIMIEEGDAIFGGTTLAILDPDWGEGDYLEELEGFDPPEELSF